MKSKSQPLSPLFSKLTYDKLALWAGPENAERGKAEMEYVRRLRRMPDGGILASVAGIKEHVACMWFDKSGELLSECTCLEGTNCHHTVSILLRCGETLKAGEEIPLLEEGDERMRALDENIENEAVTKRKGRVRKGDVEGYLATLSKQELEVLVLDLLNQNPQAKQHLITQIDLNGSNNKELIRRISKEIQKLEETQKRRENADTKGRAPDISKFEGLFKNLFERGFYEEVLDLGLALKKVSRELYDTSGKSGDSAILTPLRKCCETIEKARRKTTKTEPERLLWDILYYDGYHPRYMCGGKKSSRHSSATLQRGDVDGGHPEAGGASSPSNASRLSARPKDLVQRPSAFQSTG